MEDITRARVIETLLRDFWERPLPAFTARDAALLVRPGKADVLIGMRRAGKTWRLFQEMARLLASGMDKRHIFYLNLEDDRLDPIGPRLLAEALETFYRLSPEARTSGTHLFLDEAQRAENWSRFARRVLDTERVQLYVTGSSSKILSTEVSTEFRGRGFATEILPFSFREFVRHAGEVPPEETPGSRRRSRLERHLRSYLTVGGMPEVQGCEEAVRIRMLQDYVQLVLLRDVLERHGISNVPAARELTRAAISSTGSRFSIHKVYRDLRSRGLDVGKDTVYALMEHFEEAFLLFRVPVFGRPLRKRGAAPKKVYAVDPGLAAAMSHSTSGNVGARLETAVYLELRRRSRDPREGGISYYVTNSDREVDFAVGGSPDGDGPRFIQVCADMGDGATRRRELAALEEAMGECGAASATVVTLEESGEERTAHGAVELVPAWRWLLGL
ncbi:MAG: ATP-binding protein [Planctomycetes bacterium]|jgi:hypothetical protein|nr:ATP-binding protein [Planctomycetota bacterium]